MRKKILVAEDEDIGRFTISLMLENEYELVFAENGREAIDKSSAENPDLILMDVVMPDIDGFEAFEEIRKHNDQVKIIAVTGRTLDNEIQAIIDIGFDDYISKPIDVDILLEKINKYIG